MNEIYKPISGYEENYSVSNLGNVKNIKRGNILKAKKRRDGYLEVCLSLKNKKKSCFIHRLVALAFLDNPDNLPQVDHHDTDKKHNKVENLRWSTGQENSRNTGLRKNNKSGVKGVSWVKQLKKWQVRIGVDGIDMHLGYFIDLEDAKQVRQKKVNEVFGVFTHACEKIHI